MPAAGSFWHIDAAQLLLIGTMVAGVIRMWYTLSEFPPHKHLNKSDGGKSHEIGDTIISYPNSKR